MRTDNTMLCIYINNVFVFIHTTYTDIVEVFRGDEDGMVILSWFFLFGQLSGESLRDY